MKFLLFTFLFISQCLFLFSQQNHEDVLKKAIELSKENKFQEATKLLLPEFEKNQHNLDITLFIANLYAWQHKFDTANFYIEKAKQIDEKNQEVIRTYLNILLWSEQFEKLLEECKRAKELGYQNNEDITLKTILALKGLNRYDEVLHILGLKSPNNPIDSILTLVKKEVENKNLINALKIIDEALIKYQYNNDLLVQKANLLAWQNNHDSALHYVNKALSSDSLNYDAISSKLNILLWSARYNELLEFIKVAQKRKYKNKYDIFIKELIALKELEKYNEAISLYNHSENIIFQDSTLAKNLYYEIIKLSKKNSVSFFYSIDFFSEFSPYHYSFFEYSRNFKNLSLIARLNYANRFKKNGGQFEIDVYRKLSKNEVLYLNYGYSNYTFLFPRNRVGFEYYFPIKKIEFSAGLRYLNFKKENVLIITPSIAKTLKKNWIAYRPFITLKDSTSLFSFVLTYRKYFTTDKHFLGLEFGYGNSPDERWLYSNLSDNTLTLNKLKSYRVKLEYSHPITIKTNIQMGFHYTNEEFYAKTFRSRFTFDVLFNFRF